MNVKDLAKKIVIYSEDGYELRVDSIVPVDGGYEISGQWSDPDGNRIRVNAVKVEFDPLMYFAMMKMNAKRAMELMSDMVGGLFRMVRRKKKVS